MIKISVKIRKPDVKAIQDSCKQLFYEKANDLMHELVSKVFTGITFKVRTGHMASSWNYGYVGGESKYNTFYFKNYLSLYKTSYNTSSGVYTMRTDPNNRSDWLKEFRQKYTSARELEAEQAYNTALNSSKARHLSETVSRDEEAIRKRVYKKISSIKTKNRSSTSVYAQSVALGHISGDIGSGKRFYFSDTHHRVHIFANVGGRGNPLFMKVIRQSMFFPIHRRLQQKHERKKVNTVKVDMRGVIHYVSDERT